MTETVRKTPDTEMVATIVQDFVQMWSRFEAMLHNELAHRQNSTNAIRTGSKSHIDSSFTLFYRVANVIRNEENGMTMGELSTALSVPLSTATRIINWLVADGNVERLSDPEDRRIVRVALTASGRDLYETMQGYIEDRVHQILSCLSASEQATLFSFIGRVAAELKDVSSR